MKKLSFDLSLALLLTLATSFTTIAQTFTDETSNIPSSFTCKQPVGVADIDGDGLDDIIRMDSDDFEVCYQQANGTFTVANMTTTYTPWGLCVGDADENGANDVLFGGQNNGSSSMQIVMMDNSGQPDVMVPIPASVFVQGVNFYDIDLDGDSDAYVCHDNAANLTLANDGTGVLTEDASLMPSSPFSGNYASVWTDYDNDGDDDCYVSKCSLGASSSTDPRRINILWRNDGGGNFTEVGNSLGIDDGAQSWSSDYGDIDNDGDMDLFVLNHTDENRMYRCDIDMNGNVSYTDIVVSAGLDFNTGSDWQCIFDDFDNDGFVDLLITGQHSDLYRNNGNNTFTALSNPYPFTDDILNAAVGDLDHDGYLDIYATFDSWANAPTSTDKLLINADTGNNWVAFELTGVESNINGIGARLELHGSWGLQIREVRSGEGYGIMNTFTQHFGIGSATSIDSLVIHWPNGGTQVLDDVVMNTFRAVTESICEDNIVLLPGTDDYAAGDQELVQANVSITASNTVGAMATITYQAGDYIDLLEGFRADIQSYFEALIDDCND